jgi:hypothetical protein
MSTEISRRTALGLAAAGVMAAAAGATMVGSRACGAGGGVPRVHEDDRIAYVDRDGWMLTPAEGEKLR